MKHTRLRRRPGRHHRPAHPRVSGAARATSRCCASTPTSARTPPSAPACSTPPTWPSCACPTPPRARPRRWSTNPQHLPHRRQHRAPHARRAGSSACPSWRRASATRCAPPSASPTRAATPAAFILLLRPLVDAGLVPADAAGHRHVDHRLLGRRQEDDRAVRGAAATRALHVAAPLCADAGAQARAGDDGAHRARRSADLHAHRRQLLQGPGGDRAAAPGAAAARHHGGSAAARA